MNLIENVLRLDKKATQGPWCWESVSQDANEFVVGVAMTVDGKPISGQVVEDGENFIDDEIIRRDVIGESGPSGASFVDAALIALYRTAAPKLARALKVAMEYVKACGRDGNPLHRDALAEIEKELTNG